MFFHAADQSSFRHIAGFLMNMPFFLFLVTYKNRISLCVTGTVMGMFFCSAVRFSCIGFCSLCQRTVGINSHNR